LLAAAVRLRPVASRTLAEERLPPSTVRALPLSLLSLLDAIAAAVR
jgi:hypothetical protein